MPEAATTIHLSTLLGHLSTHKAKKEVAFFQAVVRRAALLAKHDAYRGPVEVPGYSKLVYPDDRRVPPFILEKAQSKFAAQEQMLDAVKDGREDLTRWLFPGVDLSPLDTWEYVAIKLQFVTAINEISREQYERQGHDDRTCFLWEDMAQEITKKIKTPCREGQLRRYAELVCLGHLPRSNSLTIAIADLHDAGFTEQWLKGIWLKRPDEAEVANLPKLIEATGDAMPLPGMRWQDAKEAAERHIKSNKHVFPGVNALAQIVGCSPSTIVKAVENSKYLAARKAEHENRPKKPKEVALTPLILESTPQKSEIEPCDVELARLTQEQADERERENRQHAKLQHTRTPSD